MAITLNFESIRNRIDQSRLQSDLETLAQFTEKVPEYTRKAFSPLYKEARIWLAERMRKAGLEVRVDEASNLIGKLGSGKTEMPTLILGSHIDTVEAGGRFDGIVGVIAALEVARVLNEEGVELSHPLEIIDFTCEEPTIPGLTPLGSRIMAGELQAKDVKGIKTPFGQLLTNAINDLGGDGARIEYAKRDPGSVKAYLELHIEQGPVLERAGVPIGIVTDIAARCSCLITLTGQADHAGATLMPERKDALAGAAEVILELEEIVSKPELNEETVGTVGWVQVAPNMVNIIPGQVNLRADVRSTDKQMLDQVRQRLQGAVEATANRRRLEYHLVWEDLEEPVRIPKGIQSKIAVACEKLGFPHVFLPSRATHDAARISTITPSGMIFIPCKDGKSHVPEEWAEMDDITQGTQVMLYALLDLDKSS